jgi:hypothetical protein
VITNYTVTDAAVHDSRELKNLVEEKRDNGYTRTARIRGKEYKRAYPMGYRTGYMKGVSGTSVEQGTGAGEQEEAAYTGEGGTCIWLYDEGDGRDNGAVYREEVGGICDRAYEPNV